MGLAAGLAIATVGSVVGGISKANATKNAANQAAEATTAAADKSAAVIRENYQDSAAALKPWQDSGLAANQTINSFLGLAPTQQPAQQPNALTGLGQLPGLIKGYTGGTFDLSGNQVTPANGGYDFSALIQAGFDPSVLSQPGMDPSLYSQFLPAGTPRLSQQTGTTQPTYNQQQRVDAQDGFKNYIANSDYGFQFSEGANKVNSGYAGAGTLQSGAAMKGLEDYRQNLQKGYRGEYIGALGNQQSLGSAAAAAQAGVSQNMGNSLATIFTNQGSNLANAALAKSGASTGGAIGNALGLLGGGIFGLGK